MGTPEPFLIWSPQGRVLLLLCSCLFCCVLLVWVCVYEWVEMICMTVRECHVTHTQYSDGGLVHVVEGERDHKVWSLTFIIYTHTFSTPSSPDRWCLALTACVGVWRRTTPSVCKMCPETLYPHTHTNMNTQNILTQTIFYFIYNLKASIIKNTTQILLQGQAAGLSVFMCHYVLCQSCIKPITCVLQ